MEHFELNLFLDSALSKRYRIDNYPTFDAVDSLKELASTILEPMASSIGINIIIARGFLCERLNTIAGCPGLLHVKGYAADVVPLNGDLQGFISEAEEWLRDNDVAFDESKEEIDKDGNHFWHISIYGENGEQRRKFSGNQS